MTTQEGTGAAGPQPLTITEGGVTVHMQMVGWLDLVAIPKALEAVFGMPVGNGNDAEDEAFADVLTEFAARIDAYAAPDSPNPPHRIPPAYMRRFVNRWIAEVRDAALPPASGAALRKRRSTTPRAPRQ